MAHFGILATNLHAVCRCIARTCAATWWKPAVSHSCGSRFPSLRWSPAIPAVTIFQICGNCLLFLCWLSVLPVATISQICGSCLSFLRQLSDVSSYGMNCSVSHRCAESRLYEQFRRILEGYHHEEVVSRNHSEEGYQHKRQTVKPVCYG